MTIPARLVPYLRAILTAPDLETAQREARLALKLIERAE